MTKDVKLWRGLELCGCFATLPFELRISDIRKSLCESLNYLNRARSFRLQIEV